MQACGCWKEKKAVPAESQKAREQGGRAHQSLGETEGDISGLERIGYEIHCITDNDAVAEGGRQQDSVDGAGRGDLEMEERWRSYFVATKKKTKEGQ